MSDAAVQRVLDVLDASHGLSARENAALVLGSIARSSVSPLTYSLGNAGFLNQLLDLATGLGGSGADMGQVLDVAIALLDRKATFEASLQQSQAESAPSEADLRLDEQV